MLVFGGLFLFFLAGPVFSLVFFFLKLAFALLPFVIVGGLIAFGVRALVHGGKMGFHGDWHQYRDEFRERFRDEAQRWKDYRTYRHDNNGDQVERNPQDDSEIYHI
jgi:hypothetical protein